uniref:preprotein translocase subunit SecA n=1 Tax=Rhodella violacea TaxID=2801 RepID=UPI001FCD59ED|nr:preprotein translocase subunit SecA [Rhodella violacea]UNJ18157.1 preprotein translocase subunit SecA [Rhodella violacea]
MFKFSFLNYNQRQINQYLPLIKQINDLEDNFKSLSNEQLKQKTLEFKEALSQGKSLEDILPQAFAVVREAGTRVLNLRLFDVQLIGGIILHQGKIAEMKTGEGKTLVGTLPAYLNALTEKGVHIVTVNDYLAKRDAEWTGKIYQFLGLSVGLIQQNMTKQERSASYACDITYVTNSELGFDYLKDNMVVNIDDIVQRNFYYCIIDEVDSILIDEARTPLIISETIGAYTEKYEITKNIGNILLKNEDYEVDEKQRNIILTEKGIVKCENILKLQDLYDLKNPWASYILNALRAKELFQKDIHYIVRDELVIIVDEFTGRIMPGRRWSEGLHQSVEAKENVKIQNESETLASITYQNFFLLYSKLSGMTGTAKTEETELDRIYNLKVISVPTNKPMIRTDLSDLIYTTEYFKWQAIVNECFDMYNTGRPVLVGTVSVDKSELLSKLLTNKNIPHNLLNAKPQNVARESEIIAQAGRKHGVTIATNMAGRGTDIILGGNSSYMAKSELVSCLHKILQRNISQEGLSKIIDNDYTQLGGLHIIGTERHESRRIDNQLRGRSARQGDPGSSRFFLSLEDNLFRIFGADKIKKTFQLQYFDDDTPIESIILSKALDSAQQKVESNFYDIRKQLFKYDEVLNNQREALYKERRRVLESSYLRDCIIEYAENSIYEMIQFYFKNKKKQLATHKVYLINQLTYLMGLKDSWYNWDIDDYSAEELISFCFQQVYIAYDMKELYLENHKPGVIRQLERYFLLEQIDQRWKNHLQQMSLLREAVSWRSYGQQDPLMEYKNEAFFLFLSMHRYVRDKVVYSLLRTNLINK